MTRQISEPDWKQFRHLQALALERFCQRVLEEVSRLAGETGKGSHQRYLAVVELIDRRDKELAEAFDNPRRSTALFQLARLRGEGLLSEEEFARVSPETRGLIEVLLDGYGRFHSTEL